MPLPTPAYPKPFSDLWDTLSTYIDTGDAAGGTGGTGGTVGPDTLLHMAETALPGDIAPAYQDSGFWYRGTRVQAPAQQTRIANFFTTADLSTQTAGVTADPSPDHPSGAILITAPGFTRRLPQKNLAATIDLTNKNIRIPVKITSKITASGVDDPTNLYRCRIEVSSDNFAGSDGTVTGANRSYVLLQPQNAYISIYNIWQVFSAGPSEWRTIGLGANLSSINSIRFHLENNASAVTSTLSVSHLDTFPLAPKAKCVLCFDDAYMGSADQQWTTAAGKLISRGLPGTVYANIGQYGAAEVEKLRHLQGYGWQVASHAWTNSQHTALTGNSLVQSVMRAQQRSRALGLAAGGTEDWAWWGNLAHTPANLDALRPYFRSGRLFIDSPAVGETLPPGNPLRLRGYGTGGGDITDAGAGMISWINKAIAQKGLAVITWHNSVFGTEFDNVLNHLVSNAAGIDVVTMEQALSPYLDTNSMNTVTSGDVTGIRVLTQAAYNALTYQDPRILYVVT